MLSVTFWTTLSASLALAETSKVKSTKPPSEGEFRMMFGGSVVEELEVEVVDVIVIVLVVAHKLGVSV